MAAGKRKRKFLPGRRRSDWVSVLVKLALVAVVLYQGAEKVDLALLMQIIQ